MAILYFLATVVVILWTWFYFSHKDFYKKLEAIPGPKGIWLLGNVLDFPSLNHVIPTFMRYHKDFDGLALMKLGPERNVTMSRYNYLEKLLSSSNLIVKSREYKFFKRWLAEGLLTSKGQKWQKRRKLLTPAFHFQILEQVVDVFNGTSSILVKKLKPEIGKTSTDIYPFVTLCALDVIAEASMGIKVNAQENSESEYVKSVKTLTQIAMLRTTSLWKQYDLLYRFSFDYQREMKALKILHGTTDQVIQQRRKEIIDKKQDDVDEFGQKKRKAFLDLLLSTSIDGQPLSDLDIREEVDTFMFEGHDTTASGITFTLYCLAKHPNIQEKVYEEQKSIFSDDINRNITYTDLQEMKYLEMVIKESLRLFPPVPIYGREIHEDTVINGTLFPKGIDISIFAYGAMRNEKHFPNPEVFDPERFTIDNKVNIKPYAYIPFSAGPRNCIGQKFAMMELKATVSKVVRNFKLLEVAGFEPKLSQESILKSSNGVLVRLQERK